MNKKTDPVEAPSVEIINPDPFCPVRLFQINIRGKHTDKYAVELQRPNSEEWCDIPGSTAVHSPNYRLVPNSEVRTVAQQVLDATKLEFERVPSFGLGHSKGLVWNGKDYLERWYTPNVKIETPTGSSMMLGVEVRNSYVSGQVGLAFFAMHCACSNQFAGNALMGASYSFAHIGEAGDLRENITDALAQIQAKAQGFASIIPKIKMLNDTHFANMKDFLSFRAKFIDKTGLEFRDKQLLDELGGCGITKKVGINVGDAYGKQDTFWAFANAFTAITTHAVGGTRGHEQAGRATDFLIKEAEERRAA